MTGPSLLAHFEVEFDTSPVPGTSNYVIRPKSVVEPASSEPAAAEVDWDQFEADINEAFEQIP